MHASLRRTRHTTMPRPSLARWVTLVLLAVPCFLLSVLLIATSQQPAVLGLASAQPAASQPPISWVQPAGWAWVAGVRPGDLVVTHNGPPGDPAAATHLTVQAPDGTRRMAQVGSSQALLSPYWQLTLPLLAIAFGLLASVGWLLHPHRRIAAVTLLLGSAHALTLTATMAVPTGRPLPLAVVFVGTILSSGSTLALLVMLTTPASRQRWAHGCMALVVSLGSGLIVAYTTTLSGANHHYGIIQQGIYLFLTATYGGALLTLLRSLRHARQLPAAERQLRILLVVGVGGALIPLCLLIAVLPLLRLPVRVGGDVAALSLLLLPFSLGGALLGHQFTTIEVQARRAVLAGAVWACCLIVGGIALDSLTQLGQAAPSAPGQWLALPSVQAALLLGTLPWLQHWLRQQLERRWFGLPLDAHTALHALMQALIGQQSISDVVSVALLQVGQTVQVSPLQLTLTSATGATTYQWQDAVCTGGHTEAPPTMLPLISQDGVVGQLILPTPVDGWPGDTWHYLTLAAPIIATAITGAHQRQLAEQRAADLEALHTRLIQVEEAERHRLALDLHDEPLQRVALLERALREAQTPEQWEQCRHTAADVVISLRAICGGLRPLVLDDLGLAAGLTALVEEVQVQSDMETDLHITTMDGGPLPRFTPELELALYRVTQEALTNCRKHADATQVTVELRLGRDDLRLSVEDNGQGLGPRQNGGARPLGLLGMRERLRPWGGLVALLPRPCGGSQLLVTVPLAMEGRAGTTLHH